MNIGKLLDDRGNNHTDSWRKKFFLTYLMLTVFSEKTIKKSVQK